MQSGNLRGGSKGGVEATHTPVRGPAPKQKFLSVHLDIWDENSVIICWFYVRNCIHLNIRPTKFI